MPTPIVFYKCAKCGRTFDSHDAATACEDGHLVPVAVSVKSYTTRAFPYTVEVTFCNGEKRLYNAEDLGG